MNLLYRAFDYFLRTHDAFRVERLKNQFQSCGARVTISSRVSIWNAEAMSVGDDVTIHDYTFVFAAGGISIGDGTAISCNCSLSSVTHPIPWIDRREQITKPITIGKNVWIGMGAVILPGISIGNNAVIGAGSVVTKDVGARVVAAGVPAKAIRSFELDRLDEDSGAIAAVGMLGGLNAHPAPC